MPERIRNEIDLTTYTYYSLQMYNIQFEGHERFKNYVMYYTYQNHLEYPYNQSSLIYKYLRFNRNLQIEHHQKTLYIIETYKYAI